MGLGITIKAPRKAPENFRETPELGLFNLPPAKALEFFQAKGLKTTFAWQDMIGEEHAKAFTVAKMLDMDLLSDTQAFLKQALAEGKTQQWFIDNLKPHLEAKGWWGKKELMDPITGLLVPSQLGSASRLNTIFRTNMQSSYSVGHWQQIQANADTAPWLLYDAVDDHRTRQEHADLDGTLLKVDDPFWSQYYPPNGWNCRCSAIQLSETEKKELGLKKNAPPKVPTKDWINPRTGRKRRVPENLAPGWDVNMGQLHSDALAKTLAEKTAALESAQKAKVREMMGKINAANKDLAAEIGKAELERLKNATQLKILEAKNKQILADIAAGKAHDPGKWKQKAYKKLKGDFTFDDLLNDKEKIAEINALAQSLKEHKKTLGHLNDYKKKILAGQTPTPAQQKAFKSLGEDEQKAFLAKVEAALAEKKAAAEAAKLAAAKKAAEQAAKDLELEPPDVNKPLFTDKAINLDDYTQIGGQGGSNAGGLYQNVHTGEKLYIKFPDSEDVARNEVLASKLYELAGVPNTSKAHLFKDKNGLVGVASEFIDDLKADREGLTGNTVKGVHEGFAADAWLANWDVVGLGYDNLLVKNGWAYRIDPGGALRYRAQGGLKGDIFGPKVVELDSLRDANMNPQAAGVFGHTTKDQIIEGVRGIAAISDQDLMDTIKQYGPVSAAEQKKLFDTLKARRDNLLEKYPEALTKKEPEPRRRTRVNDQDVQQVEAARVNGYSIPTDEGHIEDHNVVFAQMTRPDGTQFTRAWLKLTPDGMKQVGIGDAPGGFNDGGFFDDMTTALKGIGMQTNKGEALRDVDISRAQKAIRGFLILSKSDLPDGFVDHYKPWIDSLSNAIGTGKWENPTGGFLKKFEPKIEVKDGAIAWQDRRQNYSYNLSNFDNSHAKQQAYSQELPNSAHKFHKEDGLEAVYFPKQRDTNFTMQGVVKLDIDGGHVESIAKAYDFMERMGIKTTAPTAEIAEELYLDQLAYILNTGKKARQADYANLKGDLQKKREFVSLLAGVDDITQQPGYNPAGKRQAFDHGRVNRYRPDLQGPEWEKFKRDYVLYNNPNGLSKYGGRITDEKMLDSMLSVINGGGQISSQSDRIRRGIPLTTETADFGTGGGSYVFTRIKEKRKMKDEPGIYWKADEIRRMDAITYDGDNFGRVTEGHVDANRKVTIEQFRRAANEGADETIFKNGLSYFDNIERFVFPSKAGAEKAIKELTALGYNPWPDGRDIREVIFYVGQGGKDPTVNLDFD